MSDGPAVRWEEGMRIARHLLEELGPHVSRVSLAGSLRRRRPWIRDVEIVAELPLYSADLFGTQAPDPVEIAAVREVVEGVSTVKRGATLEVPRWISATDVLGSSLSLDLFLVSPPAQWGPILAIRTGPRSLGIEAVQRLRTRGFREKSGSVFRLDSGERVEVPDEETFFQLAGMKYEAPERRDALADHYAFGGV